MNIRQALPTDLPEIEVILSEYDLPSEDCEIHLQNFFLVEEGDRVIAVGGLESCGKSGLIRSIAVRAEYQNKGIGERLYQKIEKRAIVLGMNNLFLLTDTAVKYFERLGFVKVQRTDTPAEIAATRQYRELCPAAATVMWRALGVRP